MKVWEYIFWDAFSLAIGYWCVHWCLEPRPASPLEGCVELSQLRHQPRGGNSPWAGWLSLFATLVTAGGTKGQLTKSYNISQVFNPGVTTSKTAHFSEQVRDVPVTAWPLWTLLSACCSARSVLYWKLKWQTGWGRRVFRSSYLVRSVLPTKHMCQQYCHLDLNLLPQVCSAGQQRADDTGRFPHGESQIPGISWVGKDPLSACHMQVLEPRLDCLYKMNGFCVSSCSSDVRWSLQNSQKVHSNLTPWEQSARQWSP